jgi:hypothetical protein
LKSFNFWIPHQISTSFSSSSKWLWHVDIFLVIHFFFLQYGVWTQDLALARQAHYRGQPHPRPFFASHVFGIESEVYT